MKFLPITKQFPAELLNIENPFLTRDVFLVCCPSLQVDLRGQISTCGNGQKDNRKRQSSWNFPLHMKNSGKMVQINFSRAMRDSPMITVDNWRHFLWLATFSMIGDIFYDWRHFLWLATFSVIGDIFCDWRHLWWLATFMMIGDIYDDWRHF